MFPRLGTMLEGFFEAKNFICHVPKRIQVPKVILFDIFSTYFKNWMSDNIPQYLDKYSAQGKEYTEKLKTTIKKNSLSDFENAKLLSTGLRKGIQL